MKSIKTPCADVSFIEGSDDIIWMEYHNQNASLDDMKQHIVMMKEHLVTDERLLAISDIRKLQHGIKKEVRDYASSEEGLKQCRGVAIVVRSTISRLIGNFVMRLNPTLVPFRIFNNLEDATAWLHKLNEKQRAENDELLRLPE